MCQSRTREYAPARPEPLLRVADVQELLACSRRTVYTLIAKGQLRPLYVVDSHPRFDPEDIRSLIASGGGESNEGAA
jgi:predicted DNA-binding transcriptional regulator AlpA